MAQLDYSLSEGTMKRLGKASMAQAGAGKYAFEGVDNLMDSAVDALKTQSKDKQDKYAEKEKRINSAVEEALALKSLNQTEYNNYRQKVEALRERLLQSTDSAEEAEITRELTGIVADAGAKRDATNLTAEDLQGWTHDPFDNDSSTSNATDPKTAELMAMGIKGDYEYKDVIDEETGEPTGEQYLEFSLPNENDPEGNPEIFTFKSLTDIEDAIVPKAVEFENFLGKVALSAKSTADEKKPLDVKDVQRQIQNNLRGKDIQALMHDRLAATGAVFKDVISNEFSKYNYVDLLPPEQLKNFKGPDGKLMVKEEGEEFWYSNISEEDKNALIDAITNKNNENYNEDFSKAMLADYFLKFVQQQNADQVGIVETGAETKGQLSAIQDVAKKEMKKELGYSDTKEKTKTLNVG